MARARASLVLAAGLAASGCALLVPQSKQITATFFPDPDVEIDTPAFRKADGH